MEVRFNNLILKHVDETRLSIFVKSFFSEILD